MSSQQRTFGNIIIYEDQSLGHDVFRGYLNSLGVNIAVKVISKSDYPDYEKRIDRERKGLAVNRTIINVIRFEGIENPSNSPNYYVAYEDFYFSLKDLLLNNLNNEMPNVVDILSDSMTGVYYIHENRMTHRDIHPGNILICEVDKKFVGKISNLGLSKEFKPYASVQSVSRDFEPNGFIAPELCDSNGPYFDGVDTAVDIFSMGVVIFYALTGGEFLFAERGTDMQENIKNINFRPSYEALEMSNVLERWQIELAKQLVEKMVSRDPTMRPSASDVLNHPLFWTNKKIGEFFNRVSNYIHDHNKLMASIDDDWSIQEFGGWNENLEQPVEKFAEGWLIKIDIRFVTANLLRLARNLLEHCTDRKKEYIRRFLITHDNVVPYILDRHPNLLFHVYKKVQNLSNLSTLKEYYCDFYNFNF